MEATETTFDVLIVGFDPQAESPAERLQRAFGIGLEAAAQILCKLPAAVQRGVPRVRADYFARALVLIGAHVELRDASGTLVATHTPERQLEISAAAPLDRVVAASERPAPAFVFDAPPPTPAFALPAKQPWIDPMSQTLAAGPPVMLPAHDAPPSPHAGDVQAHPTVREMNAVMPDAIAFRAQPPARMQNADPTFVTAPRAEAQPAAAMPAPSSAGPTLLTSPPRAAATPAPIAPFSPAAFALPAAQAPTAPMATGAAPTGAAAARPVWGSAQLQAAAAARPASAWSDPQPIGAQSGDAGWPRVPSSVWDPPAAQPEISAPRDPSSVFDPPPGKAGAAARAPVVAPPLHSLGPVLDLPAPTLDPDARPGAASALEPAPKFARAAHPLDVAPKIDAPFAPAAAAAKLGALPPSLDAAQASLGAFDIAKSVVVNPLWRPPVAAPAPAAAPALTLEHDAAAAAARVLAAWEQPSAQSMAEPSLELPPEPRLPPRIGAVAPGPGAAGRAQPNSAAPAAAKRATPRARPPKPAAMDAAAPPPAGAAVKRAPAPRAAPIGRPERGPSQRSLAGVDLRSFWETVPEALVLPFTGFGMHWIIAIGLWSLAVGALLTLAHYAFLVRVPIVLMALSSTLAFACDYYRVCTWAPTTDKTVDRKPSFDPVHLFQDYLRSGRHLVLFMIASQVPAIWWFFRGLRGDDGLFGVMLDPITWILFLLPYFYWPMGVGLTALGNNFAAIWNVPAGLRVIMRVPLEYGVIVFIGVLSLGFSLLCLMLLSHVAGVTGILIASTFGFPLAISHGIQGALMGHLIRANAEAFE